MTPSPSAPVRAPTHAPGLIIAAPASGSGKTMITLGLLRAFRDIGVAVASAKVGPDYIDPRYHEAASGRVAVNLDGWAMRSGLLNHLAAEATQGCELTIIEGVMGLFDGAPGRGASSSGSTADLAAAMGWPIVLVIDAAAQAQSVAALTQGFRDFESGITLAGVILNRVGSPRHESLLRRALEAIAMPVLGAVPRAPALTLPSRHLGLVQAGEHSDLDAFIAEAGALVAVHSDLNQLRACATLSGTASEIAGEAHSPHNSHSPLAPPGQRVAVAQDAAFGFAYPHILTGWRRAGAEILPFSPLGGAGPPEDADAIFLPGGYPELHAGPLAANRAFLDGLRRAAEAGAVIYGECGGYMVLGTTLVDQDGAAHQMAGLLDLETSFAAPRLSLGYRVARARGRAPFGADGQSLRGHVFHYATVLHEAGEAAFDLTDAAGEALGAAGLRHGAVTGSFLHIIDRV